MNYRIIINGQVKENLKSDFIPTIRIGEKFKFIDTPITYQCVDIVHNQKENGAYRTDVYLTVVVA